MDDLGQRDVGCYGSMFYETPNIDRLARAAIRRGDWKLIEWQEDNRVELFKIARDLSETTDLAAREPERVAELRAELHAWQKQVGAMYPTPNANYDPAKPRGRAAIPRQRAGEKAPVEARRLTTVP